MYAFLSSILLAILPMSQIVHPVSTMNPEAQENFNKGLTYVFAYNHDLAYNYFKKASEIDPNLAMAYWGMAVALGQNVNTDVTKENEIKCYNFVQEALKRAPQASQNEQDYINALKTRYTDNPNQDFVPLRYQYRTAMKKVVEAYPQDLDAATLYSESILMLHPWKWWTYWGESTEGVEEAAQVLESVLGRNPYHVGANHFNIHAYEESPFPERALASAVRLTKLLPESGHLLHMPCHIFLLLGNYEDAVKTNTKAIMADREYIKKYGINGEYPTHYLGHNLYILARTYMLMEDFDNAYKTALSLTEFIKPHLKSHSGLQHFAKVPFEVLLYFHRWKEILNYQPIISDSPLVNCYQHFSRGMSFAYLGDPNSAQNEKELLLACKKDLPPIVEVANNPAYLVLAVAEHALNAALLRSQNDMPSSIAELKHAIGIQDRFYYDEPPAWYIPLRVTLGATYLSRKKDRKLPRPLAKPLLS